MTAAFANSPLKMKGVIDQYLAPNSSFNRLYDEFNQYGSLTIGFDFDGTVHDYHKVGANHEMVKSLLVELKEIGCKLICWTAYRDHSYVEEFLIGHNIPFDGINTDGIKLNYESRKPFFSALLDDRSGLLQTYTELELLVKLVKQNKK